MLLRDSAELSAPSVALNEKIKAHVQGNWLHNFEVDEDKEILSAQSYAYRRRVLDGVFASLFYDRSVLVLDEASGIYPALIHRAGAREVSASSSNQRTCQLISEVAEYLKTPTNVVRSKMVAFYENEPYVDMAHGDGHDFLLALGQLWPMFGAAGEDFDAVVEACAFFVTEGLVFDWTNAEWATPPPPEHYNIDTFCDALRRKFDYVTSYGDWLVVAVGKLPPGDGHGLTVTASSTPRRRPASPEDPRKAAYRQLLPHFREVVCRAVPPDATVVVISKGDDELLELEGRAAWHFPQADNGTYAGYYPADSEGAIEHLEGLRAHGARFLVLPESALWWLEHYVEFGRYLRSRYRLLLEEKGVCVIFDLGKETAD